MEERTRRSVLILGLSVTIAGCGVEPGAGVTIKADSSPAPTDSGFEMNGAIYISGENPPQDTIRDVTVCLYADNGTLLHQEPVGDFGVYDEYNVSITLETAPEYVIIDSASLDEEGISSEYYELVDDGDYYRGHVIERSEEFPVDSCV